MNCTEKAFEKTGFDFTVENRKRRCSYTASQTLGVIVNFSKRFLRQYLKFPV